MSYRCLRKLQVKNLTSKATNPTPNQLQLYTVPSLRVGRSASPCIMMNWIQNYRPVHHGKLSGFPLHFGVFGWLVDWLVGWYLLKKSEIN